MYCTCLWSDCNVRPKLVFICSSYFGGLCLIPGQFMWDLWWTKWHQHRFFWTYFFSPFSFVPPMLHTHFSSYISYTMPWNCVNSPEDFCYVCGEVTFSTRKHPLIPMLKKAYECSFGCRVWNKDKNGFLMYVVSLVLQFYVNGWITKGVQCLLPFPWYGGNQLTIWQIAIFV